MTDSGSTSAPIPFEQELELYHYAESLCSQKARVGLAEKQVPYRSNHIVICDVAEQCQNLDDDYLNVNPKGIVPTLVHNGKPVYDAHRIVRHVDRCYPDSGASLWPTAKDEVEIAEFWFDEGMLKDDQPLGTNFGTSIAMLTIPLLAHMLKRQPLEFVREKYKRHPLEFRRMAFVGMRESDSPVPPKLREQALRFLVTGLETLDRQIAHSDGSWVLREFSVVDITMMACFHRLADIHMDELLCLDRLPRVAEYWQQLQARPTYTSAIVDWHDDENWRSAIDEVYASQPAPDLPLALSLLETS